jgi:hypothetical protein
MRFFGRRRAAQLLREIRDPASIEAQLQDAATPLADPAAQQLRAFAERFVGADDSVTDQLPAFVALAASAHLSDLEAADRIPADEISGGTALTMIMHGIGLRLAEHASGSEPAIGASEHGAEIDLDGSEPHREAARVAAGLFDSWPGDWFAPGEEVWNDLSYSAWMMGAASSRALSGGVAAPVPYGELMLFGYALACVADVNEPGWQVPIFGALA